MTAIASGAPGRTGRRADAPDTRDRVLPLLALPALLFFVVFGVARSSACSR